MKPETDVLTTEMLKQLIDLAVAAGRAKQSSITGFIHHFPHVQKSGEERDAIALQDNFMFCLALLRTKTSESVLEAKTLLERLLHFQCHQSEESSNFPMYVHDFPSCLDDYQGAHLLPILFWIIKSFSTVLGSDMRTKLEKTVRGLIQYALEMDRRQPAPFSISLKIATSLVAFGTLWHDSDYVKEGEKRLQHLLEKTDDKDFITWYCPSAIAESLTALSMIYHHLEKSPWNKLWKHLSVTWHYKTCTYVGPSFKEWQSGEEPVVTLYDLYLGYYSKQLSARILQPNIVQLQAALIQPTEEVLPALDYPSVFEGKVRNCLWKIYQTKDYAYSFVETHDKFNAAEDKGFHPFRLCWGDIKRVHTFVLQGGNASSIHFVNGKGAIDCFLTFKDIPESEEREKNRDIMFFIDAHSELKFFANGQPSNTFLIGEEVAFTSKPIAFKMKFLQEDEKENLFFGHVMRSNRLSQINLKGNDRYKAYDYSIFLRAVRRLHPCTLKVTLAFDEV